MKLLRPVLVLAASIILAGPALAETRVELAGYFGLSFPGYSQRFTYDPGPISIPIPGLSITQEGAFELDGSGGLVVSGGATVYLADVIGFEARLDTAKVDARTLGQRYDLRATLPGIAQPVLATVDLGAGTFDVDTIKPWSLNLKLRTPGPGRFFASGGLSRRPDLTFVIRQKIGLGATALNLGSSQLEVSTVVLEGSLVSDPDDATTSKWGFNLGGGLQLQLSENVSLVGEGRYFYFKKQRYRWTVRPDRGLSELEQRLYDATLERLDPIEFDPQFFQATGGLAIRF
jgi:opacity protein-like surface antigen